MSKLQYIFLLNLIAILGGTSAHEKEDKVFWGAVLVCVSGYALFSLYLRDSKEKK